MRKQDLIPGTAYAVFRHAPDAQALVNGNRWRAGKPIKATFVRSGDVSTEITVVGNTGRYGSENTPYPDGPRQAVIREVGLIFALDSPGKVDRDPDGRYWRSFASYGRGWHEYVPVTEVEVENHDLVVKDGKHVAMTWEAYEASIAAAAKREEEAKADRLAREQAAAAADPGNRQRLTALLDALIEKGYDVEYRTGFYDEGREYTDVDVRSPDGALAFSIDLAYHGTVSAPPKGEGLLVGGKVNRFDVWDLAGILGV